jgi:ribosomal protein L7/L12
MCHARLSADGSSVTMFEVWGDPYNRIDSIKDVRRATGLPLMESKALVEAYKCDCAGCDRCRAEATSFAHDAELYERCAARRPPPEA